MTLSVAIALAADSPSLFQLTRVDHGDDGDRHVHAHGVAERPGQEAHDGICVADAPSLKFFSFIGVLIFDSGKLIAIIFLPFD